MSLYYFDSYIFTLTRVYFLTRWVLRLYYVISETIIYPSFINLLVYYFLYLENVLKSNQFYYTFKNFKLKKNLKCKVVRLLVQRKKILQLSHRTLDVLLLKGTLFQVSHGWIVFKRNPTERIIAVWKPKEFTQTHIRYISIELIQYILKIEAFFKRVGSKTRRITFAS